MVDFNTSFKVNKMSIKQVKMTFYNPLFKKNIFKYLIYQTVLPNSYYFWISTKFLNSVEVSLV